MGYAGVGQVLSIFFVLKLFLPGGVSALAVTTVGVFTGWFVLAG